MMNETTMVSVCWSKEAGHVQIATVEEPPRTSDSEYEMQLHGKPVDGWYVSVGRDEINKIIRDLRRARDQVYGRDE